MFVVRRVDRYENKSGIFKLFCYLIDIQLGTDIYHIIPSFDLRSCELWLK
jgi:hypothetical protein